MEIVHVYAKNITIFDKAVEGTECKVNAYTRIQPLIQSLTAFNARDVLGLVVFANPFTKGCLRLIKAYDELFLFKMTPIIIVSDNAVELVRNGAIKVRNSKLFALDSIDDSVSDTDINKIFSTLVLYNSKVYDLSVCGMEDDKVEARPKEKSLEMSDELVKLLSDLKLN